DVDADDLVGTDHPGALDHVEADAAESEDHDILARLHLRRVDDRPDAGGDAAADVAARLKWRVLPDLGDRNLGEHGKVGEGRAAHIVIDGLTLVAETRGTIGHQSLALRRADRSAKVGLARKAAFALTA